MSTSRKEFITNARMSDQTAIVRAIQNASRKQTVKFEPPVGTAVSTVSDLNKMTKLIHNWLRFSSHFNELLITFVQEPESYKLATKTIHTFDSFSANQKVLPWEQHDVGHDKTWLSQIIAKTIIENEPIAIQLTRTEITMFYDQTGKFTKRVKATKEDVEKEIASIDYMLSLDYDAKRTAKLTDIRINGYSDEKGKTLLEELDQEFAKKKEKFKTRMITYKIGDLIPNPEVKPRLYFTPKHINEWNFSSKK